MKLVAHAWAVHVGIECDDAYGSGNCNMREALYFRALSR